MAQCVSDSFLHLFINSALSTTKLSWTQEKLTVYHIQPRLPVCLVMENSIFLCSGPHSESQGVTVNLFFPTSMYPSHLRVLPSNFFFSFLYFSLCRVQVAQELILHPGLALNSLCCAGWPPGCCNLPASAFCALGWQAWATRPSWILSSTILNSKVQFFYFWNLS